MCAIKGIKRLPSGCIATFQDGRLLIDKWWNTLDHLAMVNYDYSSQVEQWRELFFDSVKIRMRSDVRIGTALSGGLDSSSVIAAMSAIGSQAHETNSRLACDWQHGICCSYPDSSQDESSYARLVAQSCNATFECVKLSSNISEFDIVESLATVQDPYLTIPIPMLETYKTIKSKGISVTLDGHGADELFSGYGQINYALWCANNYSEFREIIEIDRSTGSGVYSHKERQSVRFKLKDRLYYLLHSLGVKGVVPLRRFKSFISSKRRLNSNSIEFHSRLHEALCALSDNPVFLSLDVFSQVLYEIFHLTVLPTLLRNYDRYSMANGIEVRMPFLDWRLVSYTFSLPLQSKLGGTYTKRIQRDALSGVLIDEIRLRRDKIGWNAPAHEWFHGTLRKSLDARFLSHVNSSSKYHKDFMSAYTAFFNIKIPQYSDGQEIVEFVASIVMV